jgi:murein DD-endopeptidase MepM/ murein hydrolase activator NlpD
MRQQVAQLAHEFEAMLMSQMMQEMRKTMLSDESSEGSGYGFGNEAMMDTANVELGRALSRVGGFGLGDMLERAMQQTGAGSISADGNAASGQATAALLQATAAPAMMAATPSGAEQGQGVQPHASRVAAVATAVPRAVKALFTGSSGTHAADAARVGAPAAAAESDGEPTLVAPAGGRVTSKFGWRRDPFTGAATFHKGVDVAMAYGTEVKAAAAGRVVFAGERGGYGNMVIVEHAGGQQTRYAHLSAGAVQTGDTVDAGQVIGRVGSTGRSTGAHLHFEVLDHGQAVDPKV